MSCDLWLIIENLLKEARTIVPEFDGMSRHKLHEFINASTYAMNNIDPANEESLVQAILYTKLKGKARILRRATYKPLRN